MDSSHERSFIDQAVSYHAAGGDIDAPVRVRDDGSSGVRIRVATNGYTRLYFAASQNWCSAIKWLLQQGADVNWADAQGSTPLHNASYYGHCDAAVLLLDAGARVDDRSANAQTALHFAVGHPKMCKLLLSRGASLDARDTYGRDPEAHARFRGKTATVDLLADAGARRRRGAVLVGAAKAQRRVRLRGQRLEQRPPRDPHGGARGRREGAEGEGAAPPSPRRRRLRIFERDVGHARGREAAPGAGCHAKTDTCAAPSSSASL